MGGNKPETQKEYFVKWKDRPGNRERLRELNRQWRERNYEQERQRSFVSNLKKFGLTLEDFNEMMESQGGVCAVCGREETMRRGSVICRLAVDHDHETGRVRGLLCQACNAGIGQFGDNLERLEQAVSYLRSAMYAPVH